MKKNPKSPPRTIVKTLRLTPEENDALVRSVRMEKLSEAVILRRALDIGLPYGSTTPLEKALPEMKRATWRLHLEHRYRKDEVDALREVGQSLARIDGRTSDAAAFVDRADSVLFNIKKELIELENLLRAFNFLRGLSVEQARFLQAQLNQFAWMCTEVEMKEKFTSLAEFLQTFGGLCTKK